MSLLDWLSNVKWKEPPPVSINDVLTNAHAASWNTEKDAVEKRQLINNTWKVEFRALRVTEKQAEELRRVAPLDTNFRDVNDEYHIRVSTNSIFIHPFGSWADPGYVAFLYHDKLHYVNVALGVPIAHSLYRRADTLSYMAMILVMLHDHIGMDRPTHLIALEGNFKNPNT